MPANLNALIRYKTINSCLYGGIRRWSIAELVEKCSEALAEYRGRYEQLSERTIRDDIRVMRSDMLGYNAPIIQKDGMYYYSDPGYSIMTVTFTDSALIQRIIRLLQDLKKEVTHPELEIILHRLNDMKGGKAKEYIKKAASPEADEKAMPRAASHLRDKILHEPNVASHPYILFNELTWMDVFSVLGQL